MTILCNKNITKLKNNYSLVGVLISKINIFLNKQTFHIYIIIMKIKSNKKQITFFQI